MMALPSKILKCSLMIWWTSTERFSQEIQWLTTPICHSTTRNLIFHIFIFISFVAVSGESDMCLRDVHWLRFRVMMAIVSHHKLNLCNILLQNMYEKAVKPHTTRKSLGLILNYIMTQCDVRESPSAKKIHPGKFLERTKPTMYNKETHVTTILIPSLWASRVILTT